MNCEKHNLPMTVKSYKGLPPECPKCLEAVQERLERFMEKPR